MNLHAESKHSWCNAERHSWNWCHQSPCPSASPMWFRTIMYSMLESSHAHLHIQAVKTALDGHPAQQRKLTDQIRQQTLEGASLVADHRMVQHLATLTQQVHIEARWLACQGIAPIQARLWCWQEQLQHIQGKQSQGGLVKRLKVARNEVRQAQSLEPFEPRRCHVRSVCRTWAFLFCRQKGGALREGTAGMRYASHTWPIALPLQQGLLQHWCGLHELHGQAQVAPALPPIVQGDSAGGQRRIPKLQEAHQPVLEQ